MTNSFLFTTWEGGGNVPPVLSVARRLRRAGHQVRVMSDEANRAEILAADAAFIPWTQAPCRADKSAAADIIRDWEPATPVEALHRVIDNVICGPALLYARDVDAELRRAPADAVVGSDLLMGALVAAEAARVPVALLCPNVSIILPVAGVPPMGPGLLPARTAEEHALHAQITAGNIALFDHGLPALNAARAAFGLRALTHVMEQVVVARRILLATARAFDFAPETLPEGLAYVGPQLEDPSADEPWSAPWDPADTRPLMLVSFSTTFQNQAAALQRVLDAVRELPVRVLATVGPALAQADFVLGENTRCVVSAPHAAVMKKAQFVVCHAGHGTVIRALANDCALLVMPMGRDQNDNAVRVTARGAGLALAPDSPTDDIRAALARLISEPAFRSQAASLGAAIRAETAASRIVEELEAVACGRRA